MTPNDDWFSEPSGDSRKPHEEPRQAWWDDSNEPAAGPERAQLTGRPRRGKPTARAAGVAALAAVAALGLVGAILVGQVDAAGTPDARTPDPPMAEPSESALVPNASPAPAEAPNDPAPEEQESSATADTALALLDTLPVKGRAPKTGYDRELQFGTPWLDIDQNGCDTRNDVLSRDLLEPRKSGPCKVVSGLLNDPYTGASIDFLRGWGSSSLVQIDHVVALSNAWQTGAQQLTQDQRVAFANDPLNLLAVDGPANQEKSDGDAATWLPPQKSYRCEYVARQVSAKAAYGLWVTAPERDAIVRILESCPGEPALTQPVAAAAAVEDEMLPPVAPEPTMIPFAPVYFDSCSAARAAGLAPVFAGQAGYGRHLDRDGDGVGCE